MNKIKCIADTFAIISLRATNKFKLASKHIYFIAPSKVKEELIEISKSEDEMGRISDSLLKSSLIKFIDLDDEFKAEKGEVEVVNLANKLKVDFVVMDNIKARKKLQKKCKVPIRFSPFVIFILYEKSVLNYEESLFTIEEMKIKREWKENLIIEYAKILFDRERVS